MIQFIKYIALAICASLCWACTDVEIAENIDYSKPATVKLSIDFSNIQVITPNTRSAGDAIGQMKDVCVLFYGEDGTLVDHHYASVNPGKESIDITKSVPAGMYKVVAVANMGDLTNNAAIETLDGLESIKLQWNNDQIANNNQMFGFFEKSRDNEIDADISKNGLRAVAPTTHHAQALALSGSTELYAKLYRTVAKVTVAFDGSKLYENIFVTIKSIRLGNLPKTCSLWKENKDVRDTLAIDKATGAPSEKLTEADFGLLRVTNRGENESLFPKEAHSTTGPSLFMFENRQGSTPTTSHKDKVWSKMNYGAFIEIEAQYANEATGSNGKIVYRYMLGEDTPNSFDNYNVTRNRHYKVTLVLSKSGKEDPYWRVEYDEEPDINLPTEVNISYRHSAKLDIPFSVAEGAENGIKEIKAEIIANPWFDDLDKNGNRDAIVKTNTPKANKYGFLAWAGDPSSNDSYGAYKTSPITITKGEKGYNLSVQTEPLGFWADLGGEKADSFTGYNNYSNPRTATIEVTVTYNSGATKTAKVKVVQVPRIVNPVAIYRKYNSDKGFKIRLLNALGEEIESYGPWKAYVESGKDWIGIKKENSSGNYGSSFDSNGVGGAIRFDYKPLSVLTDKNANRCGVIVVYFSNNNVEHRIYVRQGDAPMAIGNRETLWTSYNYIGVDAQNNALYTDSPMEEGAWLKLGNSYGILANNENKDKYDDPLVWVDKFKLSNGKLLTWFSHDPIKDNAAQFIAPNHELPTQDDINNLQSLKDYSGLGIGYDDNATETVSFNEEAQYNNPQMGRRGIVICDKQGRNIFFPTGKRGYGRRRQIKKGGLHYANCTLNYESNNNFSDYRPALVNLSKAMGAIYWANGYMKLSFNYGISNIESQNADNGISDDACFARLVKQ